jgi:hypothetical protein
VKHGVRFHVCRLWFFVNATPLPDVAFEQQVQSNSAKFRGNEANPARGTRFAPKVTSLLQVGLETA